MTRKSDSLKRNIPDSLLPVVQQVLLNAALLGELPDPLATGLVLRADETNREYDRWFRDWEE